MPPEWFTLTDAMRDRGRVLASRTMERLTGHRVGVCPVTIRPCRVHTGNCEFDAGSLTGVGVVNWAGQWTNQGCSRGCAYRCELPLPAPVGRVDQVKVNGLVLDPGEYRVDDGYLLTWTGDGECPFPFGQNIAAPDDQPGTMSVTYVNAHLPGPDGVAAAAVLALEYALACSGRKCRLPDGVTTIVRQGISMTLTPGSFPDGKTGIREVDAYLGVWNPYGLLTASQVWSPDLTTNRVVG